MIRNRPVVNAIAGFLALVAFIFLLLCTLSSPIAKGIYLFRVAVSGTTNDQEMSFGVFGGCGTTSNFRTRFGSNVPNTARNLLICTPAELSYEILSSEQYRNPSGTYSYRPVVLVDHNTTSALIMNPIAAGLAGLAMLMAPIAALLKGRIMHGLTAGVLALATILTWATFGLNLAIILMVRSATNSTVMGVSRELSSSNFQWGAVMPLSLVAAVVLSVAVILSALSFFLSNDRVSDRYRSGGDKAILRGSTISSY